MNCEARIPREPLDHLIQAGDEMAELIYQLLKNNTLSNGPLARDFAEAQRKWDASARRVVQECKFKEHGMGGAELESQQQKHLARLDELANLAEGWDGRRAKKVAQDAIDGVRKLVDSVPVEWLSKMQLSPLTDGGITAEFRDGGIQADVEFEPGGRIAFGFVNSHTTTGEAIQYLRKLKQ